MARASGLFVGVRRASSWRTSTRACPDVIIEISPSHDLAILEKKKEEKRNAEGFTARAYSIVSVKH